VVTALVDNAYLHGRGEIRLELHARGHGARGDRVRVEVIDQDVEGRPGSPSRGRTRSAASA
jgi:hypothetical protein